MADTPDSTREKTAVHQYRLEAIDLMLEKHGASLEANTIAAREASVVMTHVAKTLAEHSEKLERAISCEARIEMGNQRVDALEVRVGALETEKREAARSLVPKDARGYVQIGLIVLGVLYPALYQRVMGPAAPAPAVLPTTPPPPVAVPVTPAP